MYRECSYASISKMAKPEHVPIPGTNTASYKAGNENQLVSFPDCTHVVWERDYVKTLSLVPRLMKRACKIEVKMAALEEADHAELDRYSVIQCLFCNLV